MKFDFNKKNVKIHAQIRSLLQVFQVFRALEEVIFAHLRAYGQ